MRDFALLSGVNLWVRVWLRAAQTETGNTRGSAAKKREISRTLLFINLHISVYVSILLLGFHLIILVLKILGIRVGSSTCDCSANLSYVNLVCREVIGNKTRHARE